MRFDGDHLTPGETDDPFDITLAGTASDLMLFLWHRVPPDALDVHGDTLWVSELGHRP